ncbi:nucleoid-associated protein [Mucilaginibacter sp. X5P1]|uniref:nucleoid-associated protein n=1 Tax=Mucilaginibacter sp. X5P1 TaxID=2723088 RepID=UPI0016076A0D|nr:nucleoid-associated protein [Mucilaginibacter sp. X5P1]MBB6139881.1 hypothetical protein [Mucilaginibacter sp. X5P1]
MDIIFNALFKLDVANQELTPLPVPEEKKDLKSYIEELLNKILADSDRKGFEFQSKTTEIYTLINSIINVKNNNLDEYLMHSEAIGSRLLKKEIESDQRNNLKVELLKGIVIVSLVRFDNQNNKVIISKADYDGFLDAQTYTNKVGFPLKKKIYKAFLADIDDHGNISRISVYDTNSAFTVYWWRDFLELKEVYTDEYNTENVFDAIETKILAPIKKKHKADYIALWNSSVHYFRLKPEFTSEGFIADILTGYKPFDPALNVTELEDKAKKIFEKGKFDSKFSIVPEKVSKKFKKSIPLTPQIDLNLKSDIKNLENTIMRYKQPNGDKWVMIKSEEGFEYFGDTNIMP